MSTSQMPIPPVLRTTNAALRELPASFVRVRKAQDPTVVPDLVGARREHAALGNALVQAGLSVEMLAPVDGSPESPYLADLFIPVGRRYWVKGRTDSTLRNEEAGAITRRLDPTRTVHELPPGALLSGSDVVRVGNTLWVGITERANQAGVDFLSSVAALEGLEVDVVSVRGDAHLLGAVTALPNGSVLHAAGILQRDAFPGVERVLAAESTGASAIVVEDRLIVPEEAPRTASVLAGRGYPVILTPTAALLGGRGGLARLSLRW